jgi:hypothetical protein
MDILCLKKRYTCPSFVTCRVAEIIRGAPATICSQHFRLQQIFGKYLNITSKEYSQFQLGEADPKIIIIVFLKLNIVVEVELLTSCGLVAMVVAADL